MSNLRILQICESTLAGVGTHTIDLMGGLVGEGCDVHLLYSVERIDEAFREGLERLPQVTRRILPMKRKPHPSDANVVNQVRRYIREHGPFDVIHGQSSKGGAIARLAGALGSTPVVYTPHCISTMAPTFGRVSRSIYRWMEWMLAFGTSMILCTSQEELDHIHGLGVPRNKLRVVHVGIGPPPETDRLRVRQSLGLPGDAIIVGFVGRISAQKDPQLLLRAFASAARDVANARLAFIGDGDLEASCQSLAKELGIAERVDWLGYRQGYPAMPAFDILAVPSRYETGPYVMLEAMAVGLPLAITAVGRVRECVEDGGNGFVVEPNDEAGMTLALKQLLESSELRKTFGNRARELATEFSIDAMVAHTIEAYQACRSGSVAPVPVSS